MVMTNQPIKKSINKLEAVGRVIQWAIKLNQFDIEYHPKTAIKAQALVDFIAEFIAQKKRKQQTRWKDGRFRLTIRQPERRVE